MNSVSADPRPRPRDREGIVAGFVAGLVAISCCVGPTVAALLGLTSAAVAFDLATDLYNNWGWAFRLAGLAFAVIAITLVVRRRRACGTEPRLLRSIGLVALTGVVTYVLLYGATTWLGSFADTNNSSTTRGLQ